MCIFAELTSANFLRSKFGHSVTSSRNAEATTEANLKKITKKRNAGKDDFILRDVGQGKYLLADIYEELCSISLQLFDGISEGLRSHPRLITHLLFV